MNQSENLRKISTLKPNSQENLKIDCNIIRINRLHDSKVQKIKF